MALYQGLVIDPTECPSTPWDVGEREKGKRYAVQVYIAAGSATSPSSRSSQYSNWKRATISSRIAVRVHCRTGCSGRGGVEAGREDALECLNGLAWELEPRQYTSKSVLYARQLSKTCTASIIGRVIYLSHVRYVQYDTVQNATNMCEFPRAV